MVQAETISTTTRRRALSPIGASACHPPHRPHGSANKLLVSLIDRFVVQLSQVFMLRVFPVGTNC
jgi:hypothetical protein